MQPPTSVLVAMKNEAPPAATSSRVSSNDDLEELLHNVTTHVKAIHMRDEISAVVTDFKKFIRRGNIVDLAIGMIMGTSFTAILQSLVADILSPILSLMSTQNMANYFTVIRCPKKHKDCDSSMWETPADARQAGAITINHGLFLENVLRFLVNSVFLYFAVKQAMVVIERLNKLMKQGIDSVEKNLKLDDDAPSTQNRIVPTSSK